MERRRFACAWLEFMHFHPGAARFATPFEAHNQALTRRCKTMLRSSIPEMYKIHTRYTPNARY